MLSTSDPWKPSDPEVLRLLADPRRVVPVVGAGLSLAAGLPTAAELAKHLAGSRLGTGIDLDRDDDLTYVASALGVPHGRLAVQTEISQCIQQRSAGIAPPTALRSLVHIPSRWIVTLNYDLLIEEAATAEGLRALTRTPRDALAPLRYLTADERPDDLIVFHVHGAVGDDPSSLVADADSYARVSDDGGLEKLLTVLLVNNRTCWLGTRFDESYLATLLQQLTDPSSPRHCLIGDRKGVTAIQSGERLALSAVTHGILFDSFPDGEWQCLDEFCEWLVSRVPVSSAPLVAEAGGSDGSSSISELASDVRFVHADWGPAWTKKALRALGEQAPEELAALEKAMSAGGSAEALIEENPEWLQAGSWQLWVAVARFAEEHGNWKVSSTVWEQTAEREGADRARCLVAAAVSADLANEPARYDSLLEAARAERADHPRVLLQEASRIEDPAEQLAALRQLFDEPDDIGVIARCQASIDLLQLNDFGAAFEQLSAAELESPELLQVRITRINFTVHQQRHALASGSRVDAVALQSAREGALEMRADFLAQARYGESVRTLMLAADATAMLGDFEGASTLLLTARPEESASEGGRMVLADSALRAQDGRAALQFLAELAPSPDTNVMRAHAEIDVPDETVRRRARERLIEGLDEGGHVAERAAIVLVSRSHLFPDEPFPEAAARWCEDHGDARAGIIGRAMWLHRGGQSDEARALVRSHEPETWAYEIGLQLAVWDDDSESILSFVERLLEGAPIDAATRVLCARRLAEAGQRRRAQEVAATVAMDPACPPVDRGDAFALVCHLVIDRTGDRQAGLAWLDRWETAVPNDRRQVWGRISNLLQLAKPADALQVLEASGVSIETMTEARLAGQCYVEMPDRVEGLRRLADLRDALPEPDPEFGQQAWLLVLTSGDADLPKELVDRLRPKDLSFLEQHAVSLEEMADLVRERHESAAVVHDEVTAGRAATTKLAQVIGRDLTSLWMAMIPKPAGFGDIAREERELFEAAAALGRGAVADPTALATLSQLDEAVRSMALRRLLAPLRISQSTLDDASEGASSGAGTGKVLTFDPVANAPVAIEEGQEVLDARQAQLDLVLSLAQAQTVEPDVHPDRPTSVDEYVDSQAATGARALTSSLSVAIRTGRPLYSDDRVTRDLARGLGAPAFGTGALLQALVGANAITPEEAADAIARLRELGYAGLPVLPDEIARHAKRDAESTSLDVARILQDQVLWNSSPGAQMFRAVEYLAHVYDQSPASLDDRLTEVLVSIEDSEARTFAAPALPRPDRSCIVAQVVLMGAMLGDQRGLSSAGFLAAVCDATDRVMKRRFGIPRGQTPFVAVDWTVEMFGSRGIPISLLAHLPLWHQARVLNIDPNPSRWPIDVDRLFGYSGRLKPDDISVRASSARPAPWRGGSRRRKR